MPTTSDERQTLLKELDLAMRQREIYCSDRLICRENILAVDQQLQVLKLQLDRSFS